MTTVGVVIVNYNSKDYLERCLESLFRETGGTQFSVVVIDNASRDRDFSALARRFPKVRFHLNARNLGFGTACNQGMRLLEASFFLLLNPDCLIRDSAVDRCVGFLQSRPEIGILGCRVENADGTLQRACRRSIPRPSTALYRFFGLSRLFPRSPRFAAYNLEYLDDQTPHEVEAVSGSFLLLRREVLETSGYFDEDFFLYGEDLDFCWRAGRAGWRVYYFPGGRVTHFKQVSSSRDTEAANFHFYDAMEIFYRKHFAHSAGWPERAAVLAGIRLLYWGRRLKVALTGRTGAGSRG